MVRRRQQRSRSARYPARWQRALTWVPGMVISLALLAVLGWAVGRDDPHPATIGTALIAGAAMPGPAIAIAFLAIILAAVSIRHFWLTWLAWRPGPIAIELRIPKELDAEADALRHGFISRISTLRLQAPTAVPGAAPEGDFLDTLGNGGLDEGNIANSVVTLLRAAFPSHGFRIEGDVARKPGPCGHTITVRVTRLPGEGYPPVECCGASWDTVSRRAADEATAYILPQTRRCREPWRAWRGYVMRGELLHAYEEGTRHEQQRRYDEALADYYAALEHDPLNMAIRLQVGKLQEKMGLYIDALSTYQAMRQVDRSDRGRPYKRTYTRGARYERERALRAAAYRGAVLLGGSELAAQWCKGERPDGSGRRRHEQRTRLRAHLLTELGDEVAQVGRPIREIRRWQRGQADAIGARKAPKDCPTALTSDISKLGCGELDVQACLTHVNPHRNPSEAELELRQLFAIVALRRSAVLWAEVPRGPWRGRTLNRTTIALTALCIRERLSWLQCRDQWALDTSKLRNQIAALEGRRVLPRRRAARGGFRHWHEHYNAACALALPLIPDGCEDEQLAKAAVERLAMATARADSAYLAGRRDWLVSEDPDLDGLRGTAQFKRFEAVYFPTPAVTPMRHGVVRHLENARYVVALMSEAAARWEAEWSRRAGACETPPRSVVAEWFRDERTAWRLVSELACDYTDTLTRLRFLEQMCAWGDAYGFSAVAVSMPRYEDSPLPPELSVQEAIDWCDARMEHVARASADAASAALTGEEGGDGPLERRCRLHADVWKRLGEWLAVPAAVTDASDEVEAALVGAVRAIEAFAVERDLPLPISEVGAAPAPSNGHRRFTRRMRYPRLTR